MDYLLGGPFFFLFLIMGKKIMKEVLVGISILLLAILLLPVFIGFLWLTDPSTSFGELLILQNIVVGVSVLFFLLYFGRLFTALLKSTKA